MSSSSSSSCVTSSLSIATEQPLPSISPFDGMDHSFAQTVISNGGKRFDLYGMDVVEETFFAAIRSNEKNVSMCSLDVLRVEDSTLTIGYAHLDFHHQLNVIVIDEYAGN